MRLLLSLLALALLGAAPPPQAATCEPVPVVVQTPSTPPHSTWASDGEPPRRFGAPPARTLRIAFGQQNIDAICGRPPCGKLFEGCSRGDLVVLPDPFTTDSQQFARIARHELAHVNGWPATHGD